MLSKILDKIGSLDLKADYADQQIDVFGDAYEFLMTMYASNAGKSGGEFFTPQEVSNLLARIVTIGKAEVHKVYDPACGSGSLLLQFAKLLGKENIRVSFLGIDNESTQFPCLYGIFLCFHPVLIWCHTSRFLEDPCKVLRILKAKAVCYLTDRIGRYQQLFFCNAHYLILDIFQSGLSGLFFYQVAEIVGRKAQLSGTILHSRQPFLHSIITCEIVVKQCLEASQNITVGILSCDKLTFVKTQAIIEQQLNIVGN